MQPTLSEMEVREQRIMEVVDAEQRAVGDLTKQHLYNHS